MTTQYARIVFRRGTMAKLTAELASTATTKVEGEPRWSTDTKQLHVYDGMLYRPVRTLEMAVLYNDDLVSYNDEIVFTY